MPVILMNTRETGRTEAPGLDSAVRRSEMLDRENSFRRAREALASYVRESALTLYAPERGFLKKQGSAAADGYAAWEEEDEKLLMAEAENLDGADRELFLALAETPSEKNRAAAAQWARSEQIRLSLGRIEAELTELGVSSFTGGQNLDERESLVYAAFPAAKRLSGEKTLILGLPRQSASFFENECFAHISASAIAAATDLDPVAAVPLLETLGPLLDRASFLWAEEELFHSLSMQLGVMLCESASPPGRPLELAEWFIADSGLPENVKTFASGVLRARARKAAREKRERDVLNALSAYEILDANGMDPSALPHALFASLTNGARREILTGIPRETDRREFARLSAIAVNDPGLLSEEDLTLSFDRLSVRDFKFFTALKEAFASGAEPRLPERVMAAAREWKGGGENTARDGEVARGLMEHLWGGKETVPSPETLQRLLHLRELNETGRLDREKAGLIVAELTGQAGKGAF